MSFLHRFHDPLPLTTPRLNSTPARRNARKRLNPPPPSWGKTACRIKNSKSNLIPNSFPNLQVLEPPIVPHWLRTFRRADSQLPLGPHFGRLWLSFFSFCDIFCRPKFHQKSDPPKGTPKSQNFDPGVSKARFFINFGSHFGIHFHENPETAETS